MSGFLFRALARVLSLVPLRLLHALAHPLAALLWRSASRLRRVSLANVALCYPELSPEEQAHRARRAMFHYACNALEAGVCWYGSRARFVALFEPAEGWAALRDALASGAGVVFMAPHYGAWELLGLAMSEDLGATLYKPGSDAAVDAVLIERRERFGASLVPANRRGLKALMDVLRDGGGVGVLPDQEPTEGDGRFAPFFGVPALTGVLVPRLLRRTGARAFFAGCVRGADGRFRVHVIAAEPGLYEEDMDTALAALNRGVEAVIALDPEQYLWGYKRFRARPEGAPPAY
ncbi:MAG: lysophospholipid acyltransferase family protein [Pseudomonadota bacterium]